MKITITIKTGNQAFEYDRNDEIAKVLTNLLRRMIDNDFDPEVGYGAFDTNGGKVAKAVIEEEN